MSDESPTGRTRGPDGGQSVHEFSVLGMHCADCSMTIAADLESLEGVHGVKVMLGSGRVRVVYDPDTMEPGRLEARVRALGYTTVQPTGEAGEGALERGELWAAVLAGALLGAGLLLDWLFPAQLSSALPAMRAGHIAFAASMVAGGYHVARRALAALLRRTFVADGLMLVAAAGATALGEMAEGAAVLFLFSIAELMEDYSAERNRRVLRSLLDLAPRTVTVQRDGAWVESDIEGVEVGEVAMVRPGDRVPVDGEVVRGESSIDQSAITGESALAPKAPGDPVFAGTQNVEGVLEVRATRPATDTTLARIIHLVEEAEERRAPAARFIDEFAKWYTPTVLLGAVLLATVPPVLLGVDPGTWVYRALMLLVIACPCALAISVPVAVVSAISAAAKRGVLFKGGVHLERLADIDRMAFDKTGTLTSGKVVLETVVPLGGYSADEVLALAAGLERGSSHPLATAVLEAASRAGVAPIALEGFLSRPGRGMEGVRDGRPVRLGRPDWVAGLGITVDVQRVNALMADGWTTVVVAEGDRAVGILALSDSLRPGAREAIASIGGARPMLLTGDALEVASAVARKVGIEEVHARLLPEQKAKLIEDLRARGLRVAMVGDGVNDAPALMAADVGVAMGAAGSDIAMETADIVLMRDDLNDLVYARGLAWRARGVIRQNIALAIGIKAGLAVLVVMGLATLWMAVAIGDMGASILLILNALRLATWGRSGQAVPADGPSRRVLPVTGQ